MSQMDFLNFRRQTMEMGKRQGKELYNMVWLGTTAHMYTGTYFMKRKRCSRRDEVQRFRCLPSFSRGIGILTGMGR